MTQMGPRKKFDRALYEVADRDAKAATLEYIKDMNYTTVDTTERKDFDIICKATENIHHLYEVEVKYSWKGEWNPYLTVKLKKYLIETFERVRSSFIYQWRMLVSLR